MSDIIKLQATRIRWGESDKAILFKIDEVSKWVPKSILTFEKTGEDGHNETTGILTVPKWWWEKNKNSIT